MNIVPSTHRKTKTRKPENPKHRMDIKSPDSTGNPAGSRFTTPDVVGLPLWENPAVGLPLWAPVASNIPSI